MKHEVKVQYAQEPSPRTYPFFHRPVWDWLLSIVQDPFLAPHFIWYPYRQYKYIEQHWVRFVDEPYTADRWWNIQVIVFIYLILYKLNYNWIEQIGSRILYFGSISLCRQDSAVIIWNTKGLSSHSAGVESPFTYSQ